MSPTVLVVNAGSSSLKLSLVGEEMRTLGRHSIAWGTDATRVADRDASLRGAIDALRGTSPAAGPIEAVGHRVVHGGARFSSAVAIDGEVLGALEEVRDMAPLHNGVSLDAIHLSRRLLPEALQVAAFDTAFHATLPAEQQRYPVPERWHVEWGVRRYGFHGLSVEWSLGRASELLGRPAADLSLLVAHLGSGCSVTAVEAGRSVATSMGLTPLEGLMMGTRAGSIDPGILLMLLRDGRRDPASLAEDLDHRSGLVGVSRVSGDLRAVKAAAAAGDERARLAIAMFVDRAAAGIAAAATRLDRIDALIFTGGIGEHAAEVRSRIADRLAVLDVPLLSDAEPELGGDGRLDDGSGPLAVLRIEAREDLVIAGHVRALLAG